MSRITEKEFVNQFISEDAAIDINALTEETRAALKNVGIDQKELIQIDADKDGKIKGEELKKVFNHLDTFDNIKSDGYIETVKVTDTGSQITPNWKVNEALKSEFDRNLSKARMQRPERENIDLLTKHLLADPHTASALVEKSYNDPYFFKRIQNKGSLKTKQAFAQAVLADQNLSPEKRYSMLEKLTSRDQKGSNRLTLDHVINSVQREKANGIAELMAIPSPNLSEKLAKEASPAAQTKAAHILMADKKVPWEQRNQALRTLLLNNSPQALNHILKNANDKELQDLSAIICGSEQLQKQVGKNLNPENLHRVAGGLLKLHELNVPKNVIGKAFSVMMHPENMSDQAKNDLFGRMLNNGEGQILDFLETQPHVNFSKSLLPGLKPEYAKVVHDRFKYLANESVTPYPVNEDHVGVEIVESRETQNEERKSKSKGEEERSHKYEKKGGKITTGGKVEAFDQELKTEAEGNWQRDEGKDKNVKHDETTITGETEVERTERKTSLNEKDKLKKEVRNYENKKVYGRAAQDVSNWVEAQPKNYQHDYDAAKSE